MQEVDGQGYFNSGKRDMGKQKCSSGRHDEKSKCIRNH
jgi:hypothetical protein